MAAVTQQTRHHDTDLPAEVAELRTKVNDLEVALVQARRLTAGEVAAIVGVFVLLALIAGLEVLLLIGWHDFLAAITTRPRP